MLGAGLCLGLALGGAMSVGVLLGARRPLPAIPSLAEMKLSATGSHGGETFAIATGHVDEDVEGLYTLDYVTGDLQCFVINPRTGRFSGWFKANVASIMSVEKGKKPSYLMVTGGIQTTGGSAGGRPAASLVYVADANSGEVCAFTFPWQKSATSSGVPQASPMVPLGPWKARDIALRQ
jgi:hypothetical protein